MTEVKTVNLGVTDYKTVWDLQKKVFDFRAVGNIPDMLLLNEHRHVFTLGRNSDTNHLLANEEELKFNGVEVFHIDRGGDVTYHGPGQLVVYPILDLNNYYLDIHRYLRDLEEVIIRTLSDFNMQGHRDKKFTGVWVGEDKIAAIGIKVSRWITMHGLALNVTTDLSYFNRIIPCGIFHKGVTSMQKLLGSRILLREVQKGLLSNFEKVFGVRVVEQLPDEFYRSICYVQTENEECLQAANR